MSAFPESGRSDRQKLGEIRVRLRPEADVRNWPIGYDLIPFSILVTSWQRAATAAQFGTTSKSVDSSKKTKSKIPSHIPAPPRMGGRQSKSISKIIVAV